MTMGRDNFIKVVTKGHLLPFGHRAVRLAINERKFEKKPVTTTHKANDDGLTAYLTWREFIVVKEPKKDYSYLTNTGGGRDFVYTSVEITTLITPPLYIPPSFPPPPPPPPPPTPLLHHPTFPRLTRSIQDRVNIVFFQW